MRNKNLINRSILKLVTIFFLGSSFQAKGTGLKSIYTLPCGVNNYTIIPVVDYFAKPPYTLFAADGTTIIAGPQTSNVFPNITGTAGNNFVVGVINVFTSAQIFTTITLNAGTTVINSRVDCVCTLGIPAICSATPGADSITGASYDWTSPGGLHFYQSGLVVPTQPPENGLWTISATFSASGCNYTLNNTFVLINCLSSLPIQYNYVRAIISNCKIRAEWSTAQENNTDRFEVETSGNGITDWQKIAAVAAAGTSNTDLKYSSAFPVGAASVLFIRLKQIDKDGHFNYSVVLKVNTVCDSKIDLLTITPNIIEQNSTLYVKLESSADKGRSYILLSDATGRQYLNKAISVNRSINQYVVPVVNFSKGTYFVKVINAAGNWQSNTVKLIIQ
jgi:hypothetical protein